MKGRRLPVGGTVRSILLVTLGLICVFPVYWMVTTALLPLDQVFKKPPIMTPDVGNAGAFIDALTMTPLLGWFRNSGLVAAGVSLLSVVLAILAGYALSRYRFTGKTTFGFLLFASQMLPESLVLVPLYALFVAAGLLNNLGGLVIVNTVFIMPVVAWIVKAAMDGVPFELDEASRIDGAPTMGTLGMVVLPLVLPSVAAGAVIAFFYGWNEYLFAATFITNSSGWTASVGISSFIGQYVTPLDVVFAAGTLYAVIPIGFYLVAERWIVAGMTRGAVKG